MLLLLLLFYSEIPNIVFAHPQKNETEIIVIVNRITNDKSKNEMFKLRRNLLIVSVFSSSFILTAWNILY